MRKAPKMTKADELYLKKFMKAREDMETAAIADTAAANQAKRDEAKREYDED